MLFSSCSCSPRIFHGWQKSLFSFHWASGCSHVCVRMNTPTLSIFVGGTSYARKRESFVQDISGKNMGFGVRRGKDALFSIFLQILQNFAPPQLAEFFLAFSSPICILFPPLVPFAGPHVLIPVPMALNLSNLPAGDSLGIWTYFQKPYRKPFPIPREQKVDPFSAVTGSHSLLAHNASPIRLPPLWRECDSWVQFVL